MLDKVKKIREKDPLLPIEVDGGIGDKNIVAARQAGATRFVSTGFIFNQGESAEKQYQTLCSLVT
jgi:pentose-5-phosphate-3-epimerase